MKKLLAALLCALLLSNHAISADPLPDLKANVARISVSGLSSGAAMSTQLSVAYSDRVEAVGIMAGPPYLCAQASATKAVASCLIMPADQWGIPVLNINLAKRDDMDLDNLVAATRVFADKEGSIPPLTYVRKQRIWISRGKRDKTVGPNATQAVRDFYTALGARLAPSESPDVPHTLPTDKPGLGACDGVTSDPDFVSSCKRDEVGKMLSFLFDWKPDERGLPLPANLQTFDQTPYLYSSSGRKRTPGELSMASTGRVYVPASCRQGGCKVHLALHGCQQGRDAAFDVFTRLGGYNDWAETHGLIVLYPRVLPKNDGARPINPRGCWDWWGYTPDESEDWRIYAKRNAPQMRSLMNMVDAFSGRHPR